MEKLARLVSWKFVSGAHGLSLACTLFQPHTGCRPHLPFSCGFADEQHDKVTKCFSKQPPLLMIGVRVRDIRIRNTPRLLPA